MDQIRHTTIGIDPGALDVIPYVEMARFLAPYGLLLVYGGDGLKIRKSPELLEKEREDVA